MKSLGTLLFFTCRRLKRYSFAWISFFPLLLLCERNQRDNASSLQLSCSHPDFSVRCHPCGCVTNYLLTVCKYNCTCVAAHKRLLPQKLLPLLFREHLKVHIDQKKKKNNKAVSQSQKYPFVKCYMK